MEKSVESERRGAAARTGRIEVRLLGTLALRREGVAVALPASRKVRALFAYLALAPAPVPRSQLCELLWDVPNDPRGELRWCLSKIRGIVDDPPRRRVETKDDSIRLDMSDAWIDAVVVARAIEAGIGTLAPERQRTLLARFEGDFLAGLEIDRSPGFSGWLTAQRRRFRGSRIALLEHLARSVPGAALGYVEKWLELAPFDLHAHEMLFAVLARDGRIREGEEHLASATRLFEDEGLDSMAIREAWRSARTHSAVHAKDRVVAAAANRQPAGSGHDDDALARAPRRASIAVMPFVDQSSGVPVRGGPADALAYDVIARLARLRTLFVIAQGTMFALHERRIGPEEAARMLNVDYVVSGFVRRHQNRLRVSAELAETRSARVVWAETFNASADDALVVLDEIGDRIVASVASEIETFERNRAILKPPNSLDAWEAHHRGLWHMYRFNKADNARARDFFEMAVRLDPTFARAHAGLSFTHWQNAFQGWAERGSATDLAFETAGQSLMADDRDPAAHWAMGRALWLRGGHDLSVVELERAIALSPNFALGHYTLAFVHSQAGDPDVAIRASDHSRNLSPFDPLLFGMLGARAMALVRLGRFEEAAGWAVKAASRPNAHAHILAIAAYTLALAGSLDEAGDYAAAVRRSVPRYSIEDFMSAFHFDAQGEALFRDGARQIGMS